MEKQNEGCQMSAVNECSSESGIVSTGQNTVRSSNKHVICGPFADKMQDG